MSRISFASISPHPPIIIPTIGQENLSQVQSTIKALEKVAQDLKKAQPDTIVIISPHGPVATDSFVIQNAQEFSGGFSQFGDFKTKMSFSGDQELIKAICKEAQKQSIPTSLLSESTLDHGCLVPLYYLTKNLPKVKLVPMAFSYLDYETHFKFGKIINETIEQCSKKTIGIIASGDLSHRLTPDAPAGYSVRGKEFDKKLVELLKKGDVKGILNMEPNLVEEAGECGLRSIIILLGTLDGLKYKTQILSYEGPFGVGYMVAEFSLT